MSWKNRIVGHGEEDPAIIVANPQNYRTHPQFQQKALTAVLDQVGFVQDVIINRRTGHLVDGHLRVSLAVQRKEPSLPVVYVDLDEQEEKLILATLDPIAALATQDQEMLARISAELSVEDETLRRLLAEIDGSAKKPKAGNTDPDDIPQHVETVTKPGDLWILGEHRLLCGDSTNADDVARLMAGEKAKLMATDPPYLVDYTAGNHPPSRASTQPDGSERASHNHDWDAYKDPTSGVQFYVDFMRLALQHLEERSPIYQWHADSRRNLVIDAWAQCSLLLHQVIVWVKDRAVLTRSDLMWQHEPCAYGWVQGQRPDVDRRPPANMTTIWNVAQKGEDDVEHPTPKPVELLIRPITWHLRPGEICYEPFAGSGSCIIAAEQLGRRCFAMEQAPEYVDVARVRWEKFTGRTAILEETS